MVAMDFFEASNFYDFFNQYCLNLLKNPTVRGLKSYIIKVKVIFSLKIIVTLVLHIVVTGIQVNIFGSVQPLIFKLF